MFYRQLSAEMKIITSKRLGKEIGRGILDLELLQDLELDTVVTEPGVVALEEF